VLAVSSRAGLSRGYCKDVSGKDREARNRRGVRRELKVEVKGKEWSGPTGSRGTPQAHKQGLMCSQAFTMYDVAVVPLPSTWDRL
jgi:hypothetical protein